MATASLRLKELSHLGASTSYNPVPATRWKLTGFVRQQGGAQVGTHYQCAKSSSPQVTRALFDPPPFSPDKLSVSYRVGGSWSSAPQPGSTAGEAHASPRRCYTLTHNDITGALNLTVDTDYNYRQISGFYTKLLRDEVTAEWRFDTPNPCLHIYCYVSGKERWLAPAPLRNYIFRREIPLVLDTFLYADRHLLEQQPELANAEVYVHFESSDEELNKVELWGTLGERSTWQVVPTSVLKRALWALTGQQFQQQQQQLTISPGASSPPKALQRVSLDPGRQPHAGGKVAQRQEAEQPPQQHPHNQPALNFLPVSLAAEPAASQERAAGEARCEVALAQEQQQVARHGHQGEGLRSCSESSGPIRSSSSNLVSSEQPSSSLNRASRSPGRGSRSNQHRAVGYVALDKSELLASSSSSSQWHKGGGVASGAVATDIGLDACVGEARSKALGKVQVL